jgi:hypothetical protein
VRVKIVHVKVRAGIFMSTAICLVTEKQTSELPAIDGKGLGLALDDLDSLAEGLNLEPLGGFVHITSGELEGATGGAGVDLMDYMVPQSQWFEAENMLETVFALRVHLERQPQAIAGGAAVLPELKALELALELCETREIRVRLTIDL